MRYQSFEQFIAQVAARNPGQPEFLQAVSEVIESLWPWIAQHTRYAEHGLLDRLVEPERIVMFRVSSRKSRFALRCRSSSIASSVSVRPVFIVLSSFIRSGVLDLGLIILN